MTSLAIVAMNDAAGGWGTIYYNGATFGPFRNYSLVGTDVYDEAGRTVIATEYTLNVDAFVVGDTSGSASTNVANSSTAMNDLRRRLNAAGQELRLTNLGIGDIQLNNGTPTHRDIAWGPKPKVLSINNVGGCTAFEVQWQCTFTIKECIGGAAGYGLVAFNYGITYRIDEAGLTSRVVEGYMQVSLQRAVGGGYTVSGSADTNRATYVNVIVPTGFRRADQFYRLSADRTREDFVIADQQLDCPGESPPPGCVRADVDYDINSEQPGFSRWTARLAGELEVAAGTPPSRAAAAFILIILDRWQNLQQVAQSQNGVVIPLQLSYGHKLFSRRSRFSMSWSVVSCLNDLLQNGGVWAPVQGFGVNDWAASMGQAWSQRGQANLAYNATSDAIIDLCSVAGGPPLNDFANPSTAPGGSSQVFSCGNISQQYSWLAYSNRLVARSDRNFSLHSMATGYTPATAAPTSPNDATTNLGVQITDPYTDVIQDRSSPTQYVLMIGKGLRVQYKPSVPNLLSVGGQTVEEVKRIVDGPKLVGCIFGCPVYSVRWAILYKPKSSSLFDLKSDAEKNPTLCCTPSR